MDQPNVLKIGKYIIRYNANDLAKSNGKRYKILLYMIVCRLNFMAIFGMECSIELKSPLSAF